MWSGSITFGLVHIPVALYTAEVPGELSFKLLDRRDMTPVRNRRINRDSGEVVPGKEGVRAFGGASRKKKGGGSRRAA